MVNFLAICSDKSVWFSQTNSGCLIIVFDCMVFIFGLKSSHKEYFSNFSEINFVSADGNGQHDGFIPSKAGGAC